MGLCCAPCLGLISEQDYTNIINQIHLILSGKSTKVIHHLLQEMCRSADEQDYEKALELRNQTTALQHLQERQKMQHPKRFNQDILNYKIHDNKVYLMLFNIYKGTLTNKNEFVFEYHPEFLEEFILQYYSENPIPSEIIIPEKFTESLTLFLRQKRNKNVRVCVPQKGEKKQLLNLIIKNIDIMFFAEEQVLEDLKKLLHLQETPAVIECFDISHLSGTFTVGSMVQFRNGKPDKSNYRRFRIRTVEGINDVSAIAEIIRRRYQRLIQEKTPLPNIIIVDGGRAQLNSALHELKQLQLNIPVVAIAKQFEELYLPEPFPVLRLNKKDKALHCIQRIRDEAHRFALSYNRLLRSKQVRT